VPSPPPWPEKPDFAQDFDLFWLCAYHLPPDPWPDDLPPDEWAAKYGPPGTVWTYSVQQLLNRLTVTGAGQASTALVNRYLSRLKGLKLPPFHTLSWTNPGPGHVFNEEYSMRWFRITVHGKVNGIEEVAHTFTARTQPAPDVDQSVAAVQTLANQIRDKWVAFLDDVVEGQGTSKVRDMLTADLTYDEVRVAYLEQMAPGVNAKGEHDPAKRPAYIVPTQYALFSGTTGKCNSVSPPLPYEVAMACTLNTNVRGPSYRGRVYLGGFTSFWLGAHGLWFGQPTFSLARSLGTKFIDGVNTGTGAQFQIVSRTHLHAAPVQGVRIGSVPDSQRRRRRSQLEAPAQAWGQPIGAVAP
jgi:hypothetical protein